MDKNNVSQICGKDCAEQYKNIFGLDGKGYNWGNSAILNVSTVHNYFGAFPHMNITFLMEAPVLEVELQSIGRYFSPTTVR